MKINIEQQGDISILRCGGSLDADSVNSFKKIAYDLVEQGKVRIVVDCSEVDFVDSMGLGVLISLLRRTRSHHGDVKVSALTEDVRTIFEITRLHRLFDICADSQTACRKFTRSSSKS